MRLVSPVRDGALGQLNISPAYLPDRSDKLVLDAGKVYLLEPRHLLSGSSWLRPALGSLLIAPKLESGSGG